MDECQQRTKGLSLAMGTTSKQIRISTVPLTDRHLEALSCGAPSLVPILPPPAAAADSDSDPAMAVSESTRGEALSSDPPAVNSGGIGREAFVLRLGYEQVSLRRDQQQQPRLRFFEPGDTDNGGVVGEPHLQYKAHLGSVYCLDWWQGGLAG